MAEHTDTLFQAPWVGVGGFRFDDAVAQVFPDMIRRSVPGYGHVIGLTGLIAKRFAQPNTLLYDLGCSLGATAYAIAGQVQTPGCRLVAVDNSQAMLIRAEALAADRLCDPLPIEWRLDDISTMAFAPCSVVAMNFTLQFIPLHLRAPVLSRIAEALHPGGALILAEKVACTGHAQAVLDDLHLDFKRANGYTELEIAGKRQAIEQVLVPEGPEVHQRRLLASGFTQVVEFFHCLNFRAWVAIR